MNLENDGERMDIDYFNLNYVSFNIYQKSHYKRYEFVKKLLKETDVVGDFACGSGYGTMMLSEKSKLVVGADICETTINEIKKRYLNKTNVTFEKYDLLDLKYKNYFDKIISFETIEHFNENDIKKLLSIFHRSLKPDGKLIFSTPYNQEKSEASMKFHKYFFIVEETIKNLIVGLFEIENLYYQNYETHEIIEDINPKHFIIGVLKKIN
jgi:2-polyprenyl-3-methyl-5-hydroxy-6-metoxy-1,4-benzoquinol methylase